MWDHTPEGTKILKKTPFLEVEEVLEILHTLYDAAPGPHIKLREALDRFGYAAVKVGPMLDVNVWGAGDGDGNPHMTAEVLEYQIAKFRHAIRQRYIAELQKMDDAGEEPGLREFADYKELVIVRLMHETYTTSEFLKDARPTATAGPSHGAPKAGICNGGASVCEHTCSGCGLHERMFVITPSTS